MSPNTIKPILCLRKASLTVLWQVSACALMLYSVSAKSAEVYPFSPEDSPRLEIIVEPDVEALDVELSGWYCNSSFINDTQKKIVKAVKAIAALNGLAESDFFSLAAAAKQLKPFDSLPLTLETIKAKNVELGGMSVNDYFLPSEESELVKLHFFAGENTSRVVKKSCMTPENLAAAFAQYQTVMRGLEVAVKKYQAKVDDVVEKSGSTK